VVVQLAWDRWSFLVAVSEPGVLMGCIRCEAAVSESDDVAVRLRVWRQEHAMRGGGGWRFTVTACVGSCMCQAINIYVSHFKRFTSHVMLAHLNCKFGLEKIRFVAVAASSNL
jgi:hypothetical protein